jgi:hypothetical protein
MCPTKRAVTPSMNIGCYEKVKISAAVPGAWVRAGGGFHFSKESIMLSSYVFWKAAEKV